MPEVSCTRDRCAGGLDVDDDTEFARCPKCGKEHTPPWNGGPAVPEDVEIAVERDGNGVYIHIDLG